MSDASDLLVDGRCGTCGLDVGTMKPPDAVLAVRSLPRRWGGLLTAVGDDEDLEAVLARRPEDGSWSALEHACRVVLALRLVDDHVRKALWSERPTLDATGVAPSEVEAACRGTAAEVLHDLGQAADALGATLDGVPGDAWLRPAVLGSRATTVQGLARGAAHDGTHHLREAERVLDEVRGHPD